jgi:C-terminal processing protease CtpA/Prc
MCALVLMFSSVLALGQLPSCKTCTLDFKVCSGYFGSALCIDPQRCNTCLRAKAPFLESSSPGIVLEQRAGKLLVRSVIDNSPAQRAGVQIGDELTALNGRTAGGYSCNVVWSKDYQPAVITLRRGSERINLRVSTVPLTTLIGSVDLVYASDEISIPFVLEAPFTFGFRWEEHPGYLQVAQILTGSPAEHAGLKVGDKIVSVNGANATDASVLRDGDMPKEVIIETIGGVARKQINLQSRGIAEIVGSPRQQRIAPQMQRASLRLPTP